MNFTVAGRRSYEIGPNPFSASFGTLVLVHRDARVGPRPRLTEPWESVFVRFDPAPGWSPPSGFEKLIEGAYRAQSTLIWARQRIVDAFGRLLADWRARELERTLLSLQTRRGPKLPPVRGIRRRFMLMALDEIFMLASQDPAELVRFDSRVRSALEIMDSDLIGLHTLKSLAGAIHLSPSRFGHLFMHEVGMSPMRALRLLRLQYAASQLLFTDHSVRSVASEAGFSSAAELSRQFRRQFGVSPRDYRSRRGS